MNVYAWTTGVYLRPATYEEQVAETIRRLRGFRPEIFRCYFDGDVDPTVLADPRVVAADEETAPARKAQAAREARIREWAQHKRDCRACSAAYLTFRDEDRCEAWRGVTL